MLPTDQPVAWDSLNASLLKDFLASQTGQRALASVLSNIPPFVAGPDAHGTLVSACLREGFTRALDALVDLTTHQPEQPTNEVSVTYPDLDRDELWENKPNPTETTD